MGGGRLIHWPLLEEALGIQTILQGIPGNQPAAEELAPLAAQLKAMRLKARLTQVTLAKRLGCSQALVSMAEKGKAWVGSDWVARVKEACRPEVAHPPGIRKPGMPPRVPAPAQPHS